MGETTGIEWTDKTWNPWHGCHKVSPGCKNCYMFRDKARYGQDPNVVVRSKTKFGDPLKWPHVPTMCFTCSWSDWFIEEADPWRDEAYDVIRQTPWITYQILTKRIERAKGRVPNPPLANVWLGVSVEDQRSADARIPLLLRTPAEARFISYEPALGAVDFAAIPQCMDDNEPTERQIDGPLGLHYIRHGAPFIDWVIAGGESGPDARPMHPDWVRSVRDQCQVAGVPFFFKQWGEWAPASQVAVKVGNITHAMTVDGKVAEFNCESMIAVAPSVTCWEGLRHVGKKAAGAELDGREWREFPQVGA